MSLAYTIYSVEEAQKTILKRQLLDSYDVPPVVSERLATLFGQAITPQEAVNRILADIRERGDVAVLEWNQRIDRAELSQLAIDPEQIRTAPNRIDPAVRDALQTAADRIRHFYGQQPMPNWVNEEGLGQAIRPIERVGVYVPGGTAPLPSSLLMTAVPAQVAGVSEVIVCTPPNPQGVSDVILAAAAIIGIDKVYQVGGAQAIGAMAFGTEHISRVDKILGPGNLFVTLAKRQVYGLVGIDGLPGPTETVVIADDSADPELTAADLLAQAEHDVLAAAILLTPSRDFAERVGEALQRQAAKLSRQDIIAQSFLRASGAVITADLQQAFNLSNHYAPEHLCLQIENAADWIDAVKHAGGIFVGEHSFEVLGDYVAGPSHVMPTGGTARFASPLNLWDFVKIVSVINLDPTNATELSRTAAVLAHAEGLTAHAAAAEARLGLEQQS